MFDGLDIGLPPSQSQAGSRKRKADDDDLGAPPTQGTRPRKPAQDNTAAMRTRRDRESAVFTSPVSNMKREPEDEGAQVGESQSAAVLDAAMPPTAPPPPKRRRVIPQFDDVVL